MKPAHLTIVRITAGGTIALSDRSIVHRESVDYDRPSRGPLKLGDALERDPDGLKRFIRVGDFR